VGCHRVGSGKKKARVWDLRLASDVDHTERASGDVYTASFSAVSKWVLTASKDNTARVWDLSGAAPEAVELSGHTKSVNTASFSTDGKRVVTASDDGNAIIHAVPTDDELVVLVTDSITRCLTVDQREKLGLPVVINGAADRDRIRRPPC
jgi:WD40 repeat protein